MLEKSYCRKFACLHVQLILRDWEESVALAADFGAAGLVMRRSRAMRGLSAQEGGQLMKSKISVHDREIMASEIATLTGATRRSQEPLARALWRRATAAHQPRPANLRDRAIGFRRRRSASSPSTPLIVAKAARCSRHDGFDPGNACADFTPEPYRCGDRGTQHQVIVREHGVEFQGRQYNSLSQVAHRITGSKWSGRLFFGLKKLPQEHADGSV